MKSKKMSKCDSCGKYHNDEDMEKVVIVLHKGKGCEVNQPALFANDYTPVFPKTQKVVDEPVKHVNPLPDKIKSRVPPGLTGMFIPPGDPNFDSKGDKINRKA